MENKMFRQNIEQAIAALEKILEGETTDRYWYACLLGDYKETLQELNEKEGKS